MVHIKKVYQNPMELDLWYNRIAVNDGRGPLDAGSVDRRTIDDARCASVESIHGLIRDDRSTREEWQCLVKVYMRWLRSQGSPD